MSQPLISCKKCRTSRLADSAVGRCGNCGSPEITVYRPTELDPANPTGFGPSNKGEIAAPMSRPAWSESYRGMYGFEWNGFREAEGFSEWMGIERASTGPNARVSNAADYSGLTLADLEESFCRAVRGLQGYGGARDIPGVNVAPSQLTAEWKRPEPKLKPERVEFPVDRKITVK